MIRKLLVLLAIVVALPAMAGDCPCPDDAPRVVHKAKVKPAPVFKKVADASPCPVVAHKEYHGSWLLGGGPIVYKDFGADSTKVGATIVVGYRLEHDFEFLIGPTWTPHDDLYGVVGCKPFKVDAAKPIGAQFLVVYEF